MRTLIDFSILQKYNEEVQPRGDKLSSYILRGFLDDPSIEEIINSIPPSRAKKNADKIMESIENNLD
jgi:hypothetical protein